MRMTRWCRSCAEPTSCGASLACPKRPAWLLKSASRWWAGISSRSNVEEPYLEEEGVMTFNRRKFIRAGAAAAGASAIALPSILRAQGEPIRIGLLTVKTGALASGGIDMERGL